MLCVAQHVERVVRDETAERVKRASEFILLVPIACDRALLLHYSGVLLNVPTVGRGDLPTRAHIPRTKCNHRHHQICDAVVFDVEDWHEETDLPIAPQLFQHSITGETFPSQGETFPSQARSSMKTALATTALVLVLLSPPTLSFCDRSTLSRNIRTNFLSLMVAPETHQQPTYDATTGMLLKTPATMVYVEPRTKRAVLRRDTGGFDSEVEDVEWHKDGHVWISNGRDANMKAPSLHQNGFQLLENEHVDTTIDFLSKKEVMEKYYPQCEAILQKILTEDKIQNPSGAKVLVQAFDHNIRQQQEMNKENPATQTPISLVHGDYTTTSAPRRLELLAQPPKVNDIFYESLGQDTPLLDPTIADECVRQKSRRYALINLWRSIDPDHPVLSYPLACIDAASVDEENDLRILELRYADRIGENYLVCPAPERHEWVYFHGMTMDEVLLIKQWDSDDQVPARFAIHSAFTDPATPKDAPPRKSIEVRCVAIWEAEEG